MAISKVIFEYLTLALEHASAGIIVFGMEDGPGKRNNKKPFF
ncbi:hypothetical protein ACFLQS_01975 [Actinomycetota bacterium]